MGKMKTYCQEWSTVPIHILFYSVGLYTVFFFFPFFRHFLRPFTFMSPLVNISLPWRWSCMCCIAQNIDVYAYDKPASHLTNCVHLTEHATHSWLVPELHWLKYITGSKFFDFTSAFYRVCRIFESFQRYPRYWTEEFFYPSLREGERPWESLPRLQRRWHTFTSFTSTNGVHHNVMLTWLKFLTDLFYTRLPMIWTKHYHPLSYSPNSKYIPSDTAEFFYENDV